MPPSIIFSEGTWFRFMCLTAHTCLAHTLGFQLLSELLSSPPLLQGQNLGGSPGEALWVDFVLAINGPGSLPPTQLNPESHRVGCPEILIAPLVSSSPAGPRVGGKGSLRSPF